MSKRGQYLSAVRRLPTHYQSGGAKGANSTLSGLVPTPFYMLKVAPTNNGMWTKYPGAAFNLNGQSDYSEPVWDVLDDNTLRIDSAPHCIQPSTNSTGYHNALMVNSNRVLYNDRGVVNLDGSTPTNNTDNVRLAWVIRWWLVKDGGLGMDGVPPEVSYPPPFAIFDYGNFSIANVRPLRTNFTGSQDISLDGFITGAAMKKNRAYGGVNNDIPYDYYESPYAHDSATGLPSSPPPLLTIGNVVANNRTYPCIKGVRTADFSREWALATETYFARTQRVALTFHPDMIPAGWTRQTYVTVWGMSRLVLAASSQISVFSQNGYSSGTRRFRKDGKIVNIT